MLPTAKRVAIRHRSPCVWRTYTTETTHKSELPELSFPNRKQRKSTLDTGNDERTKIPRVSVARRSIYVRAWEHPASMAEALAIVRGVERKYGRIRDFKWARDWEMPQIYQSILWAAFYSSESFYRVPKSGETLNIQAPDVDSTKEGGVGWHELKSFLKASDRVDDEFEAPAHDIMQRVIDSGDPKKHEIRPRMLDIKVERAANETVFYPNMQVPSYTNRKQLALGHALLDWGGFATLKPMFGSESPYNSDQEDVPVDSEGMRKVLNMAARFTRRPDPSFETPAVPEVTKLVKEEAEKETEKKVETHIRPTPARLRSRSWSLPPPPADSQTPISPPNRAKNARSPDGTKVPAGTVTGASATVRQQQLLTKAKQTKRPAGEIQRRPKGGDEQKQEWTVSKKESKINPTESKKPETSKRSIWDVVTKWF